jgi:hypothetical protein
MALGDVKAIIQKLIDPETRAETVESFTELLDSPEFQKVIDEDVIPTLTRSAAFFISRKMYRNRGANKFEALAAAHLASRLDTLDQRAAKSEALLRENNELMAELLKELGRIRVATGEIRGNTGEIRRDVRAGRVDSSLP